MTRDELRPEDLTKFERVEREGCGLCPRCEWRFGCLGCDVNKAWDYYARETLWHKAGVETRLEKKASRASEKSAARGQWVFRTEGSANVALRAVRWGLSKM